MYEYPDEAENSDRDRSKDWEKKQKEPLLLPVRGRNGLIYLEV